MACQEIWFDKADIKDLYLSSKLTPDVFVRKNLEFKTVIVRIQREVNYQRKSPCFFFRNRLNSNYMLHIIKNAFLFGEGFPNYPGYTHFVEGTIGWTLYLMDPS